MKIAVTGANGFVGAALCRYFSQDGHQVMALGTEREPHPNLLKYAEYKYADILKPIELLQADVCIHSTDFIPESASYKELFLNHVEGTLNVVEAARNCKRIIHISSSSVYRFNGKPVKETDASLEVPLTDYGETRLLAEEIINFDIPALQKRLILRPRAVYGVGERFLLPSLLNLLKQKTIFCPVGREVKTSLTHIENIAYAIKLFLRESDPPQLQVFNVADEPVYTVNEQIIQLLSAIEKKPLRVVPIPEKLIYLFTKVNSRLKFLRRLSPAVIKSLNQTAILDTYCIRRKLNYTPQRNFENSYTEIAEWISGMGGPRAYLKQLGNVPWLLKS